MEILKLAVPAATGLLGLVKLLDKRSALVRVLTTSLILIGGAGSGVLVQESGRLEERRAIAAEQAQKRAEEKLDMMTDALLDIQTDLAELQVQLARAPKGSTPAVGAALKATLQKVSDAKQFIRSLEPIGTRETASAPTTKPAMKPGTTDKQGQ